jgi:TolA-binding protein
MSDISDKIKKLQDRATALQTQLRATQARISALQKQQREQEQAEMLELVKSANLTPDQLRSILQSGAAATTTATAKTAAE